MPARLQIRLTEEEDRTLRELSYASGVPQRVLSAFGLIRDHFHPKQHQLTAQRYRQQLRQRFQDWREVACLNSAA